MTLDDFIDMDEALKILGWSKQYYLNVRGRDPSHPKKCKGNVIRWPRRAWFDWFMNRGRRVA